jgi:hypothetical protein
MGTKTTQKIRQSLTKKGFAEDITHHRMFWLYINDKRTNIRTRFSHGEKECGDYRLGQIAQELRLNKQELENLINCPMSQETYIQILESKGEIKHSKLK